MQCACSNTGRLCDVACRLEENGRVGAIAWAQGQDSAWVDSGAIFGVQWLKALLSGVFGASCRTNHHHASPFMGLPWRCWVA